ncbi:NUDIX hydrolase [Streptacidiphilus sp. 4-A2]|nr:NUDIX hydrolase [Streptacidiphilus sp. 4-A2]
MTSTVLHTLTVPWIRPPHRMDLLLTSGLPEEYEVTTAFVIALDSLDRMLLTRVDLPGRGWGIPGGHVDPGESPVRAAARELSEETGLSVPAERLSLFGGQRITLLEAPPADYRYPARDFMAFYTVRLEQPGAETSPPAESECGAAEVGAAGRGAAALPAGRMAEAARGAGQRPGPGRLRLTDPRWSRGVVPACPGNPRPGGRDDPSVT